MFDTNKVASNIKNARIKKNMTQMNLADEMGVSYQAVSNWERGTSMPDISKLPELCKILNISFEELVGERSAKTGIAEKLMQDENEDVTLEEMAQVGELVEPDKIERKVNEEIAKGGKIPFSALVGLAQFMDKETLGRLAEEIADTDVELKKLCAIAPFVGRETMDRIVGKYIREGRVDVHSIVAVAPFLSKSTINKVAEYLIENGQADKLVSIAPFMGKELFPSQLKDIKFDAEEQGENKSGSVDIVAERACQPHCKRDKEECTDCQFPIDADHEYHIPDKNEKYGKQVTERRLHKFPDFTRVRNHAVHQLAGAAVIDKNKREYLYLLKQLRTQVFGNLRTQYRTEIAFENIDDSNRDA